MNTTNLIGCTALALTCALSGCGGAKRGVIQHKFPGADELANLAGEPEPDISAALESAALSVRSWQLSGPFPADATQSGEAQADELTQALAKKSGGLRWTRGMHCLARELGVFAARHDGSSLPPAALKRYFGARCQAAPVQFQFLISDLGPTEELADAESSVREQFVDDVAKKLASIGSGHAGVWLGDAAGKTVATVVTGQPEATIDQLGADWDEHQTLRLVGKLHTPAEWLQLTVSHGELGYGSCKPTPKSEAVLPEFDFQCPLATEEDIALVSLVAGAPGELLGETRMLVSIARTPDSGQSVKLLEALDTGEPATAQALVSAVNRIRRSLDRVELTLSPAQSATAHKLLPHYVAAARANDTKKVNTIAMGMQAGWDIDEPIRGANIMSYTSRAMDSNPDILAELLFLPSYRQMLLDPELRAIAMAVRSDAQTHSATTLASTYKFFDAMDYAPYEQGLFDELDRQRAAKGLPPVQRIGGESTNEVFDPVLARLARGEVEPAAGMNGILEHYATKLARAFRGYTMASMVLDGWMPTFGGELMTAKKPSVAIRVGHYTSPESSWGQYIVYIVYMIE